MDTGNTTQQKSVQFELMLYDGRGTTVATWGPFDSVAEAETRQQEIEVGMTPDPHKRFDVWAVEDEPA